MAQHDYVIANGTGAAVRSDLNNALAAIVSQNSGATEPATTYAFQFWADTTTSTLKLRNSANNAWIELMQLDGTLTMEDGTEALPGLSFRSDLDTGLWRPGANQLAISTNAVERVEFGASEVVFNDGGANYDFRVEGDTNANLLFVDASADAVGIGTSSPAEKLHIAGNATLGTSSSDAPVISLYGNPGATFGASPRIQFANQNSYGIGFTSEIFSATGIDLRMYDGDNTANRGISVTGSSGTPKFKIGMDGVGYISSKLGIGTTSPGQKLQVSGAGSQYTSIISTDSDNTGVLFGDAAKVDEGYVLYANSDNSLRFGANGGSERARIDSSGRLLVGTSSSSNLYAIGGSNFAPKVQIQGTDPIELGIQRTDGPVYVHIANGQSGLGNGNDVGFISFNGKDSNNLLVQAAQISAAVDGTPGANDMPGRLVFSTTADGASSPTERMRITQAGYFKFANNGVILNATDNQNTIKQTNNDINTLFYSSDTSYSTRMVQFECARSANSAYAFLHCYSSGADLEFNLRGDGNAFADGTWSGGGADYAEYFEWSDSNTDEEDRRGISVVLDGDKIREAVAGEDPIGVISGNPSVVGDAAWNKWSGKHLRDEFGTYLLDENGERQLNPAYDPDQEYIPREQRPEWDCVGLMGKLRIRKGQVTGSRWIKMRNISDTVEEWLVR